MNMTRMNQSASIPLERKPLHPGVIILILIALVVLAALLHLGIGSRYISPQDVLHALFHPEKHNFDHHIIHSLRLPRMLGAVTAGAALGLAGALIQAVTRNPLGEPQLLGLNAGAAFAVVASSSLSVPVLSSASMRPFTAAVGGAILFGLVLLFAQVGRRGLTIIKLTFCGISLSAFASALTSGLLILDEDSLQDLRIWLAGDLAESGMRVVLNGMPAAICGALLVAAISRRIRTLSLGDDVAKGLGTPVNTTRAIALAAAALLCGAAVSIAGPLGFIGLVAPHMANYLGSGIGNRRLISSSLCGAILVLLADVIARTALAPHELATGVVTAFVGVPVFLVLVLRSRQ